MTRAVDRFMAKVETELKGESVRAYAAGFEHGSATATGVCIKLARTLAENGESAAAVLSALETFKELADDPSP